MSRPYHNQATIVHASSKIRHKLRSILEPPQLNEEEQDLEEEDFMLASTTKAKALNHERDYHRQSTRIESFDQYTLISILCCGTAYYSLDRSVLTLNPDLEGFYFFEVILRNAIQITAGASALCGLYATMVFSVSILYGKAALGMERDLQYDSFLHETGDLRIKAFWAFSLSLGLFALMVALMLASNLPMILELPVGGLMVWALYVGYRDWKRLVDSASEIYLDD